MRLFLPACLVALSFACGPMPLAPPDAGTLSLLPQTSNTSPSRGAVLGPCTGEDGSACGGGQGVCFPSMNVTGQKQCLAVVDASTPCPQGSFGAEWREGRFVCLTHCSTVRDCATGFFCNATTLTDARRELREVSVCMPGVMNLAGRACRRQADCERGATDLSCVGATASSDGVCTRACTTNAQCQGGGNDLAVCGVDTMGRGLCLQRCDSLCTGGLVCQSNVCLPRPSAPPPASAGEMGGPCTAHGQCGAGSFCITTKPGGECSSTCSSDAQCGQNGVCVTLISGGQSYCFQKCVAPGGQSNCRSQRRCDALSGVSYGFCI